ncbi:arylmalonate decarboxylase [Sphingomonas crocodyli]|uniref:maleate cis-trans isomerase family protein n=1 Tax=Sphingomonas crocodyli TaxID=1979270 RepID=UPI0019D06140|nr:arylmalonate decarboxylase [Sphingomonas crocodyli]
MTDTLGYRKLIGLVVPSTNTSVQPECERLRPAGVTNHIARVTIPERPLTSDQAYDEHLQAMRDGISPAIAQVMTCGPDHIVMGVAIEAFWGGVAQADRFQAMLAEQAGVGVSMGSTAAVAGLKAFGAKRIAVLTPHQPKGDAVVQAYLEEAGFDIARLKGLKCASPRLIAHVTPSEIRQALKELDGDDIDAILQVGTNLASIQVMAEAERWLEKPVLAMNAVTYWDALRRVGIEDRIAGCGRILEEF